MENSHDVYFLGQRISEPIDQSETRTTVGFRISTHEVEEGFFSTENQDGDWFGQRSGGKWRFDVGSPFRLARKEGRRRKRATSAVTSGLQDC